MMTRRHFAVAAAASLGSGLVLGKARALDPMRFDRPVRLALAQHFDAVARGNADALSAVWAPGAQVQHVARTEKGQETVQSEPAAEAIQRWTKDPDLFA